MKVKLTNSVSKCRAGQNLALGVLLDARSKIYIAVVRTEVLFWNNNNGEISFVLAVKKRKPEDLAIVFAGKANQGTRNGNAKMLFDITRIERDRGSLTLFGKGGVELDQLETSNGTEA